MSTSLLMGLALNSATLGAGVGVRTTPLRITTFGDSTADFFGLNGNTDVSAWAYEFTAGTQQVTKRFEKTLVDHLYGQSFKVGNGGIGGQTTVQMLARSGLGASATRKAMEDVIALAPDVVLLRLPINDLTGFTPPIVQANLDALYARIKTMIDTFADAGIWVLSTGGYGYSGATNTAQVRAAIVTINAMMAAYSRPRFRFIDINGITHDGTGAFIAGISGDGTHLQNRGGIVVAKLEAAALRSIFGTPLGPRYPGTNVIPNADLSASGSQAYGIVGTGWSVGVTNGTRANAKIETIGGVLMQTCEYTPTADNCIGQIGIPFGVFGATPTIVIAAGEIYGLEADLYVAGVGGGAPPAGGFNQRMELFTGTPRNLYGPLETAFNDSVGEVFQGKVIFEPITIPDFGGNPANLTSNCRWLTSLTAGLTGDRTPFKMGIGNPRMVKLN